ncbi:hypothetical protein ACJRO7_003690 [Eucalyptus globulus]|uniref:Uncharacterized protein n=1 Tax=Eucalyptus globulus TaxID=34317 RepID=A0ABD3IUX9_EUCGL
MDKTGQKRDRFRSACALPKDRSGVGGRRKQRPHSLPTSRGDARAVPPGAAPGGPAAENVLSAGAPVGREECGQGEILRCRVCARGVRADPASETTHGSPPAPDIERPEHRTEP